MLELIGKYAAEIIAICAMATTVFQAWESRRHNRLSVTPHITYESARLINPNSAKLHAFLNNKGIGPAIIEEFTVLLEGKPCEPNAAVGHVLGGLKCFKTVATLASGSALSPGERRTILSLKFEISSPDDVEKIEAKLNKLDLKVKYRSMYGKKFTLDSRDER